MTDLDDLLDNDPSPPSGEGALWLAVTIDAFFTLRDGGSGYHEGGARKWIEDQDNIFFEAVADQLGYSPGGLRERIREAVARGKAGRRVKKGENEVRRLCSSNISFVSD